MFEKEIEFIYKYNLNKIKHLGSFITYEQLLTTNIHPALLQYLSAEIDFLIYEDRQKLLKESLFDYSGDKIVEYFLSIGEEIKKTKKFSSEYLSKLLLHASSFNTNFIIRPKWSLMQFIFENENESTKQIIEVKQILNYVYYYPFLKRLLINFFNKKRIVTISADELEELLNKIDKINYESNFDKVLDTAFNSMAEFIYAGEMNNRKISKQFVELFLEDKGLDKLKFLLVDKLGVGNKSKFDIIEFKKILLNDDFGTEILQDNIINQSEDTFKEISLPKVDGVYEEEIENEDLPIAKSEILNQNEIIEEDPKSFLESHIKNVEEQVVDFAETKNEELELPDLDEDRRIDDKNIDEIYDLAIEEEELDSFVEVDNSLLNRIKIDDSSDPLETKIDNLDSENVEKEEKQTNGDNLEKGFVKLGSSITFNTTDLVTKLENETTNSENKDDTEEWASESSSNFDSNLGIKIEADKENDISDFIPEKTENGIMEEINLKSDEIESFVNAFEQDETNDKNEITNNMEEFEPMLFTENELADDLNDKINTEIISKDNEQKTELPNSIDISVMLDNKKIPKIIEVVFDYDMEDFSKAIDDISEAKSETEAHNIIDQIAKKAFLDASLKEIKLFKNIVSEFYK